MVDGVELDVEGFKKWRPEYADAEFILKMANTSAVRKWKKCPSPNTMWSTLMTS